MKTKSTRGVHSRYESGISPYEGAREKTPRRDPESFFPAVRPKTEAEAVLWDGEGWVEKHRMWGPGRWRRAAKKKGGGPEPDLGHVEEGWGGVCLFTAQHSPALQLEQRTRNTCQNPGLEV